MIKTSDLIKGNEYYFFFQKYFCAGFVSKTEDNKLHIRNGGFLYYNEMFRFDEATLDIKCIIGFANT